MDEKIKSGSKMAGAALAGILAGSQLPHSVKYEIPPLTKIVAEDNRGTDGTDPSKVEVVTKIPVGDGTYREVRIRKNQVSNLPKRGDVVE